MNTDKIYAESIASEYAPKQTSKVVALKKLDRQAKLGANIFTYSFGIISALVLGAGHPESCYRRTLAQLGLCVCGGQRGASAAAEGYRFCELRGQK